MKKTLTCLLVLAMLFTFCGCRRAEHKIEFIIDGKVYAKIYTDGNEIITLPNNPQKEEHAFVAWYFDDGIWQKPLSANTFQAKELTENVKVYAKWQKAAKVVILSGQSNMFGSGAIADISAESVGQARYNKLSKPINNIKILMEKGGSSDDFKALKIGVGHLWDSGFGPELGLAEYFSEHVAEDETVYVVKYALLGTKLYDTWVSPSRRDFEVTEAYNSLVGLIDNALRILIQDDIKPQIAGFCWMQGESDCELQEAIDTYGTNLSAFVRDLRERYNAYSVGGCMNFIDARIGQPNTVAESINQEKMRFRNEDPAHNALVNTQAPNLVKQGVNGLTFTDDNIHYDSISVLKLGQMFAEQIDKMTRTKK